MNKGIKPVRKTQNNKRPYLLTVERFGHWQYVAMVRDMWSFCAELVHCQTVVGQSSAAVCSFPAVIRQWLGSRQEVVRQLSGSRQTVVD